MHPAARRSRGQVEHAHSSSVKVEVAAIRGHRFHDAEGDLRLISELAGMNVFGARLGASLKSVDRPEPGDDLGPIHSADRYAEGVADGHAEECAEELILRCVCHLTHPNSPASAGTSLTPNRSNPRLPACYDSRHSGQEPCLDIV